jgi:REP element-mobilizing transposase RayT
MKLTEGHLEAARPVSLKQEEEKGWYSRGYLPHFDVSGIYQAITYRLADSFPGSAGVPPALRAKEAGGTPALPAFALNANGSRASLPQSDAKKTEQRQKIERDLDKGYGSCILREGEIAKIVVDGWKYFDGERYDLVAYVVMPNHVHLLIKTYEGFPLSKVLHSWKSFSAHKIIKHLEICGRDARAPGGRDSKIWQNEYFDRFIRDERHFSQTIAYIYENPVKAGLCHHAEEWLWSSIKESPNIKGRR